MKSALTLIFFTLVNTVQAQIVTIGNQVWMTKNLNLDKFRNGDHIPHAKTNDEWEKAGENKQPAWCYYDNDPANGAKYGKLYNWYAVADLRGLCPTGWHVPSDNEWTVLTNALGGDSLAGDKMKSTSGWKSYTTGGHPKPCPKCESWNPEYRSKVPCHTCRDTRYFGETPTLNQSGNGKNSSGFSGLPAGSRNSSPSEFGYVGEDVTWWSSTENNSDGAIIFALHFKYDNDIRYYFGKGLGFSVRCLKD